MSALPPILIVPNSPPTPSQPAKFSPQTLATNAGDNLTWTNNDSHAHWPAPSAASKTDWFQYQIPPGSESPGTLALGPNAISVSAVTPGSPTVFTTKSNAPASGVTVKLTYSPTSNPPPAWQTAVHGKSFVVTNLGATSCSIPLDSSALGVPANQITMFAPYVINYVCALHPDETGTLNVNPQP
jgi:hypothetical protein